MPTEPETARIAAAMHALRPGWGTNALTAHLTANHADRPYRDLAIAAVRVATNPHANTPAVLADPTVWDNPPADLTANHRPRNCPIHPSAPERCGHCRSEHLTGDGWPHGTRHPDAPTTHR